MKSLGAMITQLDSMVGGSDLTPWEDDFVISISERVGTFRDTTRLSAKQVEIIERIYRKHFGDAE